MEPNHFSQQAGDYRRIERAIRYLQDNFRSRPGLDEIARSIHLSRFHFSRLFKRWAGISPDRFLHFLSLEYAKEKLAESQDLLTTALDTGLSGPGRLHDLFVTYEAMTPGEFKRRGAGLAIHHGLCPTPFGPCLLAFTPRGLCYLGFALEERPAEPLRQLQQTFPAAVFTEDKAGAAAMAGRIFRPAPLPDSRPFHLHLKGTNFQVKVWQALLTIPAGRMISYQDLAAFLGQPRASRAVAGAVAANPVAYLIPCHRVIAKSGRIHEYRWGAERKKAMIAWEAARMK